MGITEKMHFGHGRLSNDDIDRSLTTPLHGPEAIECIRHSSLSDLFSNNIIKIRHTIKTLIDDPSRLCRSPLVMAVSCSSVTTAKATIAFGQTLFQWFVSDVINSTVHIKNCLIQSEQK